LVEKSANDFFTSWDFCIWYRQWLKANGLYFHGLMTNKMADEKKPQPPQNQINIELTEEIAEGIYSNLAMIAHSNSEFVIDFIRLMPGVPKAKVKSRIVITPEHAKRFLHALKDNIEKYEASFGAIKRTEDMPKFPMNFGGTMGEA
jgi:hypothetical protein